VHELYPELEGLAVQVKDVTDDYYTLGWLTVEGRILSFVQAPGGAIFPLAPNTYESAATDLNDIGLAAGSARFGDGTGAAHAALFAYGVTIPVETLLAPADDAAWTWLSDATAVSNAAVVVGNGILGNSAQAWLVRPPS